MASGALYLLGPAGEAALRAFVDGRTLFAFDLDGTLAPIVADPARVSVSPAIRARLRAIDRAAPMVVVTGRSPADARRRLGVRTRQLVGSHGAAGVPGMAGAERAWSRLGTCWARQLRSLLPEAAALGVLVEEKGASLALHYRSAPDRRRARRAILRAVGALVPLPRRVHGKLVEDLLPPEAPGKGDALAALVRRLGCRRALYVGDDRTDEDVFRLRSPDVFGVRVGHRRGTAARAYLRRQSEIVALLDQILALLASPRRRGRSAPCGPRGGSAAER